MRSLKISPCRRRVFPSFGGVSWLDLGFGGRGRTYVKPSLAFELMEILDIFVCEMVESDGWETPWFSVEVCVELV